MMMLQSVSTFNHSYNVKKGRCKELGGVLLIFECGKVRCQSEVHRVLCLDDEVTNSLVLLLSSLALLPIELL